VENQTGSWPLKINFLLFLVMLFLSLTIPWNPPVWISFADARDYLFQAHIPITDIDFFAPQKSGSFLPRPFTVPLIYKMACCDPDAIIQIQKLIHCFSTFFLVYAVLLHIRSTVIKYLMMICIYLLMSWWNIVGWDIALLSESLSISLLFCWIASFLILIKKKDALSLILHMVITLLFAFTKEAWPYIIVIFYTLAVGMFYKYGKGLMRTAFILLSFGIILLVLSVRMSDASHRYKINLVNTIALRILPDPGYFQWFKDHGMPDADRLRKDLDGADATGNRGKLYKLYTDTTYAAFYGWIESKGKSTYTNFLLTHPYYTFLLGEKKNDIRKIFAYNLFIYTGEEKGYTVAVQNIFPLFSWYVVLILCALLIVAFTKFRQQILLLPPLIIIVFTLHAILSYNADAIEVERHLLATGIIIQFLGFFSLALLLDLIDYKKLRMFTSQKSQTQF